MRAIYIVYDNFCPMCRRSVFMAKKIDWLGKLNFIKLRETANLESLDLEKATREIATYTSNKKKIYYGFNSILLVSSRVPAFWLFLPILFLLKFIGLGQIFYKKIANNRTVNFGNCKVCSE